MVPTTKTSLLFILLVASSAFADETKPVSDADFNALIKGQLNKPCTCGQSCPNGWVYFEGRCFIYFAQQMDWASAEAHCLNRGAHLVSIHNVNENKLVKSLIRTHNPKEDPTWLGLSNCEKTNSWIWSDGTKFGYSMWNPKEPNHVNGECCGQINWSSQFGPQKDWNDIPCNNQYPFVCVKSLV